MYLSEIVPDTQSFTILDTNPLTGNQKKRVIPSQFSPPVEEYDVDNNRRHRGEPDSITHGEEGAQIQRTLFLVGHKIEMKVVVDDGGDVVGLTTGGEKPVREKGEILRLVEVQPVGRRSDDVHDDEIASGYVGGGEPWAG